MKYTKKYKVEIYYKLLCSLQYILSVGKLNLKTFSYIQLKKKQLHIYSEYYPYNDMSFSFQIERLMTEVTYVEILDPGQYFGG